MKVTVKLFASIRDAVGASVLNLELPERQTLSDLLRRLTADYPSVSGVSDRLTYAVNRRYAALDQVLADGDEIVILPPVAGGAANRHEITESDIVPADVVALVEYPGAGAIVTFTGVVREFANSGRPVTHLVYEAYAQMAEEQFATIASEIDAKWSIPADRVAIHHRVGRLAVGDTAVVIAIASPHRQEAFEACQYAIDRLKVIVPVWKKEIGPDGTEWVE